MKHSALKADIKAIGQAARIYRDDERRLRDRNRRERARGAEEGDISRRDYERAELYTLRVNTLRPAARSAQLAYAFLRGRSYVSV